jgi:hypothetical protein
MINIKYKLEFFGLNKQSLKRKVNKQSSKKLKRLLEKRGTSYFLFEIKYIIKTLYSNMTTNKKIPSYYKKKNIENFSRVLDLIEVEEKDNLFEKIDNDIKIIYKKSLECYISDIDLDNYFKKIAKKYSISLKYIENIFIRLNEEQYINI